MNQVAGCVAEKCVVLRDTSVLEVDSCRIMSYPISSPDVLILGEVFRGPARLRRPVVMNQVTGCVAGKCVLRRDITALQVDYHRIIGRKRVWQGMRIDLGGCRSLERKRRPVVMNQVTGCVTGKCVLRRDITALQVDYHRINGSMKN